MDTIGPKGFPGPPGLDGVPGRPGSRWYQRTEWNARFSAGSKGDKAGMNFDFGQFLTLFHKNKLLSIIRLGVGTSLDLNFEITSSMNV